MSIIILFLRRKLSKRIKQQSVGIEVFGSKADLGIPSEFVPGGSAIEKSQPGRWKWPTSVAAA